MHSNIVEMGRGHHSLIWTYKFMNTVTTMLLVEALLLSFATINSLTSPRLLHILPKRNCHLYSGPGGVTSLYELISAQNGYLSQFSFSFSNSGYSMTLWSWCALYESCPLLQKTDRYLGFFLHFLLHLVLSILEVVPFWLRDDTDVKCVTWIVEPLHWWTERDPVEAMR